MAGYIDRKHFDERIRIAVGMSEDDLTEDFKDGVLFVLGLLEDEEKANVIEIPKGTTNGDMIKAMFPYIKIHEHKKTDICDAYIQIDIWDFSICVSKDWWDAPYSRK